MYDLIGDTHGHADALQKLLGHEMPSEMQHAARRAEKLMESFGMKVDMTK
jgi:hypothetical protein